VWAWFFGNEAANNKEGPKCTRPVTASGPQAPAGIIKRMTHDLFRQDAYLTHCTATVTAITPQGIVLDRTVFYPLGGGQAGDTGRLILANGSEITIVDTRKGKTEDGRFTHEIAHQPGPDVLEMLLNSEHSSPPGLAVGETVTACIDVERRLRMMRFHTCSHLLCHIVPQLVNGCSITPDYARLDFNMTEPLDKDMLSQAIAGLVAQALPVTVGTITDAELDANPALVKSMSVQPPRGSGQIRTIQIGADILVDLQPCGGTHVANTAEIGHVIVTKIEKKSANTRRVVLGFAP